MSDPTKPEPTLDKRAASDRRNIMAALATAYRLARSSGAPANVPIAESIQGVAAGMVEAHPELEADAATAFAAGAKPE